MKRHCTSALFLALFVLPVAAHAQHASRAQIAAQLTGFEREPDVTVVAGWGTSGVAELEALADDAAQPLVVRMRAVHVLRAFPNAPDVAHWLRLAALDPRRPVLVRRTALDALSEGFGDLTTAVTALHDADAQLRDGAAWTLARSTDPRARAAMQAALATERDPTVRQTLARGQRAAH